MNLILISQIAITMVLAGFCSFSPQQKPKQPTISRPLATIPLPSCTVVEINIEELEKFDNSITNDINQNPFGNSFPQYYNCIRYPDTKNMIIAKAPVSIITIETQNPILTRIKVWIEFKSIQANGDIIKPYSNRSPQRDWQIGDGYCLIRQDTVIAAFAYVALPYS